MAPDATPPNSRLAGLFEFIRFVATGSIAAISNLIARYLLDFFLVFEVAVVLAYIVGMVVAFILFQKVIFGDPQTPLSRRIFRFCVVNALGAFLALAVSSAMARIVLPAAGWTFHPAELAHFVGVAVPAFTSYFLHKHYTFK